MSALLLGSTPRPAIEVYSSLGAVGVTLSEVGYMPTKLSPDELFCGSWINEYDVAYCITRIKGSHRYRLRINGEVRALYDSQKSAKVAGKKTEV